MRLGTIILIFCIASGFVPYARASNQVTVESKSVYDGVTTSVGIYLENEDYILSFDVPLVIRSLSGNAFWSQMDSISWKFLRDPDPTGVRIVDGQFVDYTSPDQLLLRWFGGFTIGYIPPGSDLSGEPGIRIFLDVNNNIGSFEFDTLFYPPEHQLVFVADTKSTEIYPNFEIGIINVVECDVCPNQGDVAPVATSGDGIINVLDVIALIDYVFRSGPTPPQDGTCPRSRGDIDGGVGDDAVNILDVTYSIDHVFRSGPPPSDPCNP